MDSNDLFSFLDEAPAKADSPQADGDVSIQEPNPFNGAPSKKRKVSPPTDQSNGEAGPSASPNDDAGPTPKKQRLASPNPVVVDEVEIEAKREVAASAGLTGAVEAGSRLELRHQVRICSGSEPSSAHAARRCDTKSRCPRATPTYPYPNMFLPKNQHANTSSLWTRSSKCLCMQYSGMRACSSRPTQVPERLSWQSMLLLSVYSRSSE